MSISLHVRPVLRRAAFVAVTIFALAPVACTSDVEEEEEPVASDAEELNGTRCTRAPAQPAGTCRVYRADLKTTIGCPWGQARRWMRMTQTGCVRVPGSVCVDGVSTRQTLEMRDWPSCN